MSFLPTTGLFQATNYITNPKALTDTTGWATYADAAQNIPVDGTGGSATNLTFSRSTSSPLEGPASFTMVQTNSQNIQGKGVGYAFTINSSDQAKVLSIQFDFNASSTFVASNGTTAPLNDGTSSTNAGNSDVEVFLYDVTNAILIPVSPQVITGNGSNNFTFKGTFQTASNSTSYRLIYHVAMASANATGWTFKFDNVYVGPQNLAQGVPSTDWTSYTPTGTWTTNSTYTGKWRRVGDSMEVEVNVALAGAPNSATFTDINLPTGYTIDTTKMTTVAANTRSLGTGWTQSAGSTYLVNPVYRSTTSIRPDVFNSAGTNLVDAAITQAAPGTYTL